MLAWPSSTPYFTIFFSTSVNALCLANRTLATAVHHHQQQSCHEHSIRSRLRHGTDGKYLDGTESDIIGMPDRTVEQADAGRWLARIIIGIEKGTAAMREVLRHIQIMPVAKSRSVIGLIVGLVLADTIAVEILLLLRQHEV